MVAGSSEQVGADGDRWFLKGATAFEQQDYLYAVVYYAKAVEHCPDNLDFRRQLHRSSRRRQKQAAPITKADSVKLAASRGRLRTAKSQKNWTDVDRFAEECIAIDPWDATLFVDLAHAAVEMGRYELAKYSWTSALTIDKDNSAYYREFGALLEEHKDYEMARTCYIRLGELDPKGHEAKELLQAIEVAVLMNRGYGGAWNARDVEDGKPAAQDTQEVDVTAEVPSTGPDLRLGQLVKSGDEYVRSGKLSRALDAFRRAVELDPDSAPLRRRAEDIELAVLRHQALNARKAAREQPDNERLRQTAKQKVNLVTSRELGILTERVKESPEDLTQVLRLADLYRRSNQLELAVPLFEQVSSEPDLCAEALIGLGECWVKTDGRAEHGRIQLENALRLIDPVAKPACYKLANYWLARLFEKRNRFDEADSHYEKIVAIDPDFQDAAARRLSLFQQQIDMENLANEESQQ